MAGLTWTLRLLIYFLLSDGTLGRTSPPSRPQITPQSLSQKESELKIKDETTINKASTGPVHNEHRLASAYQVVQDISASLHGQIDLHSNASCTELAAGPWGGKGFSQELLGLAMVPVLVSAGCWREAQALVVNLYSVLGQNDTHQFLQDILTMIQRAKEREPTHSHRTVKNEKQAPPPVLNPASHRHLQAVVFNIEQLAQMGVTNSSYKSKMEHRRHCKGWVRVTDTQLLGQSNGRDGLSSLEEAQRVCRNLGVKCAGVTHRSSGPGSYHAILRPGSRAAPSSSHDSWIRNCNRRSVRWGRNAAPRHHCVNESEERVYTVVEWIPAVSTLYNLGTAVYYASVNCYDTAKERAILSTVDLGTDALMAVTGGTAGVAGYALGAGLKTGVKAGIKYLLNTMKEEDDLLMNQNSWEDGTLTIQ